MLKISGGRPPFPTFEAACVESFKVEQLAGQEEGLAPARDLSSTLIFSLIRFACLFSALKVCDDEADHAVVDV